MASDSFTNPEITQGKDGNPTKRTLEQPPEPLRSLIEPVPCLFLRGSRAVLETMPNADAIIAAPKNIYFLTLPEFMFDGCSDTCCSNPDCKVPGMLTSAGVITKDIATSTGVDIVVGQTIRCRNCQQERASWDPKVPLKI